jgi:gingipain R
LKICSYPNPTIIKGRQPKINNTVISSIQIYFVKNLKKIIMLKKFVLVLMISVFFHFNMNAEWVSVTKTTSSNNPPKTTILNSGANSTTLKIDISGFTVEEFRTKSGTYQSVDLLSEVFITEAGSPELPYISKILAVPDQASISVEIVEVGETLVFKDIKLPPARESWFEGTPESLYKENSRAYKSSGVFPANMVKIEPPLIFRDFRVARLSVFPVQYLAGKNEIHVVSSITVKVSYGNQRAHNPKTTPKRKISPSFAKLYRSVIANYQEVLENQYNGEEDGRELMLCIMPDEFVESFQSYAEWKRQSGTDIHITKFSDIGANSNNPETIKDHIAEA